MRKTGKKHCPECDARLRPFAFSKRWPAKAKGLMLTTGILLVTWTPAVLYLGLQRVGRIGGVILVVILAILIPGLPVAAIGRPLSVAKCPSCGWSGPQAEVRSA